LFLLLGAFLLFASQSILKPESATIAAPWYKILFS
jgi:hypothetical protein